RNLPLPSEDPAGAGPRTLTAAEGIRVRCEMMYDQVLSKPGGGDLQDRVENYFLAVLIFGEPGIGKSRLTAALSEHIGTEPHTRVRYFCSPYYQGSAFYPFIVQLERAAGFARDDAVEAKLAKLRALLVPGTRDDDDIAL